MVAEPKVFDIRGAECRIDGRLMTDVGPDGFSISPSGETSVIGGLTGEVGFNQDPTTSAEATCSLKSTSPENAFLRNIRAQQQAGTKGPVVFEILVKENWRAAFGFTKKTLRYAMIGDFPEFATSEKESPDYEWVFQGYGYTEE